jgi:hypothetical protein
MRKVALIVTVALSGCATVNVQELNSLINQGRCAEAYQMAGATSDPIRYNNMGVVAHNCERNPATARRYFEYGARLGEQMAVNNLLRNGWPVPSPDIRAANDARDATREAGVANAIQILQMAQPKPQPIQPFTPMNRQLSCVTKFRNGNAYTDCD